jgi:uncharacterized membrane protein
MYAKDYRRQAWESLRGKWGISILVLLIYSVIISASSMVAVGPLLLEGILMFGVCGYFMNLIRNERTDLTQMFDGFSNNLVDNLITGLLYNLYIALWSLLFVIPGLVKSYSYAMTFYILRDNPGMTANEAITASREMMNGNKMKLFLLDLSFIGWILLTIVTFGIASFWTLPYMQAARAAFYEDIKNS